jgi:hypothetical protein
MAYPIYFFKVNILTAPELLSSVLPGTNREQLLYQLLNKTVWVDGVPRPLKHGDTFTLFGSEALRVRKLYVDQGNQFPFVLEMFDIPNVENLELTQDESELTLTWTGNESFYVIVETTIDDGSTIRTQLNKGIDTFTFKGAVGRNVIRLKFSDGQGNVSREYATVSAVVEAPEPEDTRQLAGQIFAITQDYNDSGVIKDSLYKLEEEEEAYTPEFLARFTYPYTNYTSHAIALNPNNDLVYVFGQKQVEQENGDTVTTFVFESLNISTGEITTINGDVECDLSQIYSMTYHDDHFIVSATSGESSVLATISLEGTVSTLSVVARNIYGLIMGSGVLYGAMADGATAYLTMFDPETGTETGVPINIDFTNFPDSSIANYWRNISGLGFTGGLFVATMILDEFQPAIIKFDLEGLVSQIAILPIEMSNLVVMPDQIIAITERLDDTFAQGTVCRIDELPVEQLLMLSRIENDQAATLACNTYDGWVYRFCLREYGDD